jgi:hypothetical protein
MVRPWGTRSEFPSAIGLLTPAEAYLRRTLPVAPVGPLVLVLYDRGDHAISLILIDSPSGCRKRQAESTQSARSASNRCYARKAHIARLRREITPCSYRSSLACRQPFALRQETTGRSALSFRRLPSTRKPSSTRLWLVTEDNSPRPQSREVRNESCERPDSNRKTVKVLHNGS